MLLALTARLHRIRESPYVPARFPHLRVHDDRAIHAYHGDFLSVGSGRRIADHVVPPGLLDVVFQLDAERAVVPEAVDAAVDFARLKDEPLAPAQGDQFFHVHPTNSKGYCESPRTAVRGLGR